MSSCSAATFVGQGWILLIPALDPMSSELVLLSDTLKEAPSNMKSITAAIVTSGVAPALISAGCPASCSGSSLQLSCHNTSAVQNLCCFNAPGGELLQTQFWDYDPATGPADSWTVHGLW